MVIAFPHAWGRFDAQRRALGPEGQPLVSLVSLWADTAGLTERFVQRNAERLFALEICNRDNGRVAPAVIEYLEGKL
jgi:hypothetical protein